MHIKNLDLPEYQGNRRFLQGYEQVLQYVSYIRAYYDVLTRHSALFKDEPMPDPINFAQIHNFSQT